MYQLSSFGLRFFNVYGPRQDPTSPYSGVISIFADRLLKEQSITINGGYQTRDFVYVKDVVECIYHAIALSSQQKICEVINILTGNSVTIDYLAGQISEVLDVQAEKNYKNLPPGDPEPLELDTVGYKNIAIVRIIYIIKNIFLMVFRI